jgi:hypothetical protein
MPRHRRNLKTGRYAPRTAIAGCLTRTKSMRQAEGHTVVETPGAGATPVTHDHQHSWFWDQTDLARSYDGLVRRPSSCAHAVN